MTVVIKTLLKFFARRMITKYRPFIVGVTGSVGKTSTRHAIAAALSKRYRVREPEKNYNNELGLPITVIGLTGFEERDRLFWLKAFATAAWRTIAPQRYPEVLVLEYGIDHPGEMDALLDIVTPIVGVITTIGISHNEHFSKPEDIAFEKGKMAARLPSNGTFVYNADDLHVIAQTERTKAKTLSYGIDQVANVHLDRIEETLGLEPSTTLHVTTPVRTLAITIPVIGKTHVAAVLAAVAVAEVMEVETESLLNGLKTYKPVPGRLNVIAGIKHTTLIDDTYNAAPDSVHEALKILSRMPNQYSMAILGDMLELGSLSEQSHREIGELVSELDINFLVTVGASGKIIAESARTAGMPIERMLSFETSEEAKHAVREIIKPDSVVLIKGSQGMRMEKITKEIMAEPMRAPELLPRQYGHWLHD